MAVNWPAHTRDIRVLGRRLHYVDVGHGPVILLLHGLGGSWQTWLENIPVLASDHRVIAVDLPGFGSSEEIPKPAEMSTHVDTLIALLGQLEIDQAVVVGHSMGGLISLAMAARHPQQVRGLVLVSAGGIKLGPARLAMIVGGFSIFNAMFGIRGVPVAFAQRPRLRRALLSPALDDWRSLSPSLASEIVPLMRAPGFGPAVRGAARAVNMTDPADVRCPTLIIWGRNDRILPVAGAQELAAAMPDASLVVLEDVGHCAMFERPDEFNWAVLDFMAGYRPTDVPPRLFTTRRQVRRARRAARRIAREAADDRVKQH